VIAVPLWVALIIIGLGAVAWVYDLLVKLPRRRQQAAVRRQSMIKTTNGE
jgi:hypothetical protein